MFNWQHLNFQAWLIGGFEDVGEESNGDEDFYPPLNERHGDSGKDNINPFAKRLQITSKYFFQPSLTQVNFPIIKST
jgi:hypothetical protein